MNSSRQSSAWVDISRQPPTPTLRVCGELDLSSRDLIGAVLLGEILTSDKVVIDLGALTYCDSSGIAIFLAAHEKAEVQGTTLVFADLQPAVARAFAAGGVDEVLTITA